MGGLKMDYYKRVLDMSNQILVFFAADKDLLEVLDKKYREHQTGNMARHLFWKEVRGRIRRISSYTEYLDMLNLETKYFKDLERVSDPASLIRSPTRLKWVGSLGKLSDIVNNVFDYHIEHDLREELLTQKQKATQCLDALRFFNAQHVKDPSPEAMFPYLTLLRYSIEGLICNKALLTDFYPFLESVAIPLLRAQRHHLLVFLELLEQEQEYIAKGLADDIIEIPVREEGETEEDFEEKKISQVFTRYYEADSVPVVVPPPVDPDKDMYLCPFGRTLLAITSDKKPIITSWRKAVSKDWHRNPLATLFLIDMHVKDLKLEDSYMPAVSPLLILECYRLVEAHKKVYSPDVLMSSNAYGIIEALNQYEKADVSERTILQSRVADEWDEFKRVLFGMVEKGLITPNQAGASLNFVTEVASDVGFVPSQ